MQTIEYAVTRLTETHQVKVGDATGECAPLLEMLRQARYPNLGRTKGGGGSGDMFDVKAVEMYETIDAGVRAWLQHFRHEHTGELIDATKKLHEVIKTEAAGGRLEDEERMLGMFPTWVDRIEDHFDPPHEYELIAVCPDCGESHAEDTEGQRKRAVRVQVKAGRALIAECHNCGTLTVGQDALTSLAERMGIEADWVAVRKAFDTDIERVAEVQKIA